MEQGDDARDALDCLIGKLVRSGLKVTVAPLPTIDTLRERWSIVRSFFQR